MAITSITDNLQKVVSSIGKSDTAVAEPPETTPVDTQTPDNPPQEPKAQEPNPEAPKTEDPKPEAPKPEEPKVEALPGEKPEEAKPEEKPTEPQKPIDWGSKEYLKDKQSKNGEDTFRYKELAEDMGKALNLQPNSDSDIILKEIESLKNRATSTDNIFANDSLRQANEIAKNGGDYLDYLGLANLNVDSTSDEELIRLKMQENGNSEEVINDYLEENKDTTGQKKEAAEIRQSLKYTREQRTKELADQSKASADQRNVQVQEANDNLRKTINEATEINGFNLDDDAKARILDIATGTTTIGDKKVSKLFAYFLYNEKGTLDPQKTFNTIAKAEYFDGITDYLKNEGKRDGKRELMDNLQNVEIDSNPSAQKEEPAEEITGLGSILRSAKASGKKPLQEMQSRMKKP